MIEAFKEYVRNLRLPPPPFWMVSAILLMVIASWIPLAWIARAKTTRSPARPIQIFLDMDLQPRYDPQEPSPVFLDGRAMRPRVEGTVAREDVIGDAHYTMGFETGPDGAPVMVEAEDGTVSPRWYDTYPSRVEVTESFMRRGRRQYNISCSPCHGLDGRGKGPVNQRALELMEAGSPLGTQWVQAADLTDATRRGRPLGHLYNTIKNGLNNMPGYASQIPVHDRWAIVAYVRALQLSAHAPQEVVPAETLGTLK